MLIEIAVATRLLPLIAEPINLQELNQVAVLVKHDKNRVPRFSIQRSKNPFVFCRLEMKGSLPVCYFCCTNTHSHSIMSKTTLLRKKEDHSGRGQEQDFSFKIWKMVYILSSLDLKKKKTVFHVPVFSFIVLASKYKGRCSHVL